MSINEEIDDKLRSFNSFLSTTIRNNEKRIKSVISGL